MQGLILWDTLNCSVWFNRHERQNDKMETMCITYSKLSHEKIAINWSSIFLLHCQWQNVVMNGRMEEWTDDEECNNRQSTAHNQGY